MIQNILDSGGNIIGTLELPDGTSQSAVAAALAIYKYVPTPPVNHLIAQVIGGSVVGIVTTQNDVTASLLASFNVFPTTGQTCDYVICLDGVSPTPSVGWTYTNGQFTAPSSS